jgi:hypothetical protein
VPGAVELDARGAASVPPSPPMLVRAEAPELRLVHEWLDRDSRPLPVASHDSSAGPDGAWMAG